jgi:AraC family transcriptional regulator
MSRLPSSQPSSEQNQPDRSPDVPRFSDGVPLPPVLTSYEAGWNSVSLEYYCQPAGETPKLCLDHYAIGIYIGQGFELEHQIDEVANGRLRKEIYFNGGVTLIPMQHSYWGRWRQTIQAFMLNLQSDLLTRSAAELLAVDQVELLPRTLLYDPLILQIALALKADLDSHRPGGRLYAETLTNALAVHLLRNYSSHTHKPVHCLGGLSFTQLNPVLDYIHDHLDQDLSLEELAAIAQLSPYHFCRSFKQSMGFTPHQYVIRQRVERAKLLLKDGKMGILEVAIACGFTHQSHLNRHFKRLTGMTPKKFSNS